MPDLKLNVDLLAKDLKTLVGEQAAKVLNDPLEVGKKIIEDIPVAIFGRQPNLITDVTNIINDTVHLAVDSGITIFNAIPSTTPAPSFPELPGNINAGSGKIITNTTTTAGASIGELSWLIYTGNAQTNPAITSKWKLENFSETTSGSDTSIYVNTKDKQVAITFEGTSPNSAFSTWVLSKDGVSDLEIGLGIIPNQVIEEYQHFTTLIARVENTYGSQGYGISLAGHSAGGAMAQMMAGMYFIDTGVALPALSQEGPGMLRQLQMYAEEQLIAGKSIHLPTGGTLNLSSSTLLQRANKAKAVVNTFSAQDFSNVINLLTEQDVVGQVRYHIDPSKDGHVGINIMMPAILTPRECLQDIDYEAMYPINSLNITTNQLPKDPLNLFPGLSNMDLSRIDRHLPGQSEGLWSGSTLGLYDPKGDIGVGMQIERTNGTPIQKWAGTNTTIPEVEIFGTTTGQVINVGQYVTSKQNALVVSSTGNDTIYGSNNGDLLIGGSGNDTIYGGNGDNYLSGGTGNAKLYGSTGNDIIYAGSGNSYMTGGGGNNLLIGGTGNDTFYWSKGNDIMFNGQAGGNYDFIIANGATGNSELKWERNFKNIGSSLVEIQGDINKNSHLLFNFVDEIRFADMQWSQAGNDITMVDHMGNKTGTVTFKNATQAFSQNNGQLDFQFTNGSLYVSDETYHVVAGIGTLSAVDNSKYKGNIIVGGVGNNTMVSGSGNDLLFGGVGTDVFVFDNNFGHDQIVSSNSNDTVKFNKMFDAKEFFINKKADNLVINYQQSGTTTTSVLTLDNWYASSDKVNQFTFNDATYSISNNYFQKIS